MALYVDGKKIVNSLVVESDAVALLPTPTKATKAAICRFNTDLTENLLHAVAEFSASQAAGTPSPSNPIDIDGVELVHFIRTGKNLICGRLTKTGINASGVIGAAQANDVVYAPVKKNQNYVFSNYSGTVVYAFYNEVPESGSQSVDQSRTNYTGYFTATIDGYVALRIAEAATPQLEIGTTETDYQASQALTEEIDMGSDYYGGTVDAVTGKIILDHGIKKFDGSENWTATDTHIFRLVTTGQNWLPVNAANWQKGYLSNILRTDVRATGATSDKLPDHSFYITSQYLYVRCDEFETVQAFQTALGTTNLILCTPLSTEAEGYAFNTAEIATLNGLNQLFADTGDVEAEFLETVGHKVL